VEVSLLDVQMCSLVVVQSLKLAQCAMKTS